MASCEHTYTVESLDDGSDLLDVAAERAVAAPVFYLERPDGGEALLGVGSAHAIRTDGPRRLELASREAMEVLAACRVQQSGFGAKPNEPRQLPSPRFVGGFGFGEQQEAGAMWREFPACFLFLPQKLWVRSEGRSWLVSTSCCRVNGRNAVSADAQSARTPAREREQVRSAHSSNGCDDPTACQAERDVWMRRVGRILSLVADGQVEKVVLSRSRTLESGGRGQPAVVQLLRQLRAARPACYTFWASGGDTHFVGSSPELLVRRRGGKVDTQAVAGTVERGATPSEDRALAQRLLSSAKNLREQGAVTSAIEDALRPVVASLRVGKAPDLLALPEAYHLHTCIEGDLRVPLSVLELAALLHPTPAVCGTPRDVAYSLLEGERRARGWYTGAVGWLGSGGDGAFAVALRAALIDGQSTTLWAGAGIVDGSDPDAEFYETEIKMRALGRILDEHEGLRP